MESKHLERFRRIGRNIARYREELGLTQEEFAVKVGLSSSYIEKIEAPGSDKACSLVALFDIADFLGIDVCLLINNDSEN
jgi:transcriptional regulator with XRE-family HTH domain